MTGSQVIWINKINARPVKLLNSVTKDFSQTRVYQFIRAQNGVLGFASILILNFRRSPGVYYSGERIFLQGVSHGGRKRQL